MQSKDQTLKKLFHRTRFSPRYLIFREHLTMELLADFVRLNCFLVSILLNIICELLMFYCYSES